MMSGEATIKELLKRNSRIILAVLLLPAIGMIIAMVLIAVRGASNILHICLILGVILAQYLLFVAYIWKKMYSSTPIKPDLSRTPVLKSEGKSFNRKLVSIVEAP